MNGIGAAVPGDEEIAGPAPPSNAPAVSPTDGAEEGGAAPGPRALLPLPLICTPDPESSITTVTFMRPPQGRIA